MSSNKAWVLLLESLKSPYQPFCMVKNDKRQTTDAFPKVEAKIKHLHFNKGLLFETEFQVETKSLQGHHYGPATRHLHGEIPQQQHHITAHIIALGKQIIFIFSQQNS